MTFNFKHLSKPKSLSAQIKDSEQQVLDGQRKVGVRTAKLVQKIKQQMTAPGTLLLSAGIGFILGELTKSKPYRPGDTFIRSGNTEISPLRIALSLMTSIQTLYAALPMIWILKSFIHPDSSRQTSKNAGANS
jgi:hypothetical protein